MIELLVVIVILGVLAASMVPVVGRFLSAGDDAASRNNLMRLGRAALAYKGDKDGCYPAAGGWFTQFSLYENGRRERRYGRAAGWVYFEHDCPRTKGDIEAADKIGNGNANKYGFGEVDENGKVQGDFVNEEGICTCFSSKTKEGGINAKPAGWRKGSGGGQWSLAEVAIMNGCLFPYTDNSLGTYVSASFAKRAAEKLEGVKRTEVVRAYAMNVITGTDSDLYDIPSNHSYSGGGPSYVSYAIRYGQQTLRPWVDNSVRAEAMPARTALFVELDVDNDALTSENSLEGDQVWDWDKGNESMGFIHEDGGMRTAHVCFADGHAEAIRDPSKDSENPDTAKRRKLSKWYGSGGLNAEAEKLD